MSPKGSWDEGMVTSWWHYWYVVETLGGGVKLEKAGYWKHAFEGYIGNLVPGFSHPILPSHHNVTRFAKPYPSAIIFCLTTDPKTRKPADHGQKLLKHESK
jgi:hypothetical protein